MLIKMPRNPQSRTFPSMKAGRVTPENTDVITAQVCSGDSDIRIFADNVQHGIVNKYK